MLYSLRPFVYIISSDVLGFIDHFVPFIRLQETSEKRHESALAEFQTN